MIPSGLVCGGICYRSAEEQDGQCRGRISTTPGVSGEAHGAERCSSGCSEDRRRDVSALEQPDDGQATEGRTDEIGTIQHANRAARASQGQADDKTGQDEGNCQDERRNSQGGKFGHRAAAHGRKWDDEIRHVRNGKHQRERNRRHWQKASGARRREQGPAQENQHCA